MSRTRCVSQLSSSANALLGSTSSSTGGSSLTRSTALASASAYVRPASSSPTCSYHTSSARAASKGPVAAQRRLVHVQAGSQVVAGRRGIVLDAPTSSARGVWRRPAPRSASPFRPTLTSRTSASASASASSFHSSARAAISPEAMAATASGAAEAPAPEARLVHRPEAPEEPDVEKNGEPRIVLTQRAQEVGGRFVARLLGHEPWWSGEDRSHSPFFCPFF